MPATGVVAAGTAPSCRAGPRPKLRRPSTPGAALLATAGALLLRLSGRPSCGRVFASPQATQANSAEKQRQNSSRQSLAGAPCQPLRSSHSGRAQATHRMRLPGMKALAGGEQAGAAFALAALSSFFNGSFPVCARIPKGPALDPVLFNGLVCCGVFLSSLLVPVLFGTPFVFTLGGFLGGSLFVFAALFSFVAIPRAGLATAQAVWSCSAILVAFGWGAFGPAEVAAPVVDAQLCGAALALLVAGALIIVNCDAIAQRFSTDVKDDMTSSLNPSSDSDGQESKTSTGDRAAGIASAMAVGLFGGSVLVPFKFIPPESAGLLALPSFGLGALIAGTLVTAAYWKVIKKEEGLPPAPAGDAVLAGLASGLLWNTGNVCSIIAQSPPFSLPYGIAYPILQCALFFGGLWGIFAFKEIQGKAIGVFGAGALTLAGGIVLLSLYGPGA
ncbi:unnamed protein product [Polarella glacialis]|uniref:EamA domain-containing protein n=2 Tax=Polarella glacialis TaxID=89957 RepID=A0A813IYH4_POLGL|nr:unnamed protein product [Polarella glacialis]CAE8658561.1 unnamed protein product [Polarella glacialis]